MAESGHLKLTFGQQEALGRVLLRRGIRLPSDSGELANWLLDSSQLTPAFRYVSRILAESGPNAPEQSSVNQRTLIFCNFNTFDPISVARAESLNCFLEALTEDATLITDKKALRSLVRDINRVHEKSLDRGYSLINEALERYNDNMSLGRPVVQCLENLLKEFEAYRVFSCFARTDDVGSVFRDTWSKAHKFIEAARDGKTYPDEMISPVVTGMYDKLCELYHQETLYWYHEDMLRAYVRDTLLPHAIVNNYIDPTETTDVFGALWRFVRDVRSDSTLWVCPPLLFHQPQQPGPRYIGLSELQAELKTRELDPRSFPHLEYRLTTKLEERPPERCVDTRIPFQHSFLRLTRAIDYIPHIIESLGEPLVRYAPSVREWLPTTFWAIDPAYGMAGRHLTATLGGLIDPVIEQSLKTPTNDEANSVREEFQSGFEKTMENIVAILRDPIDSYDGNHETPVDPYEVREALVNAAMLGIYQPRSDWEEERTIAQAFSDAVSAAARFEIEPEAPINKIHAVDKIEQLIETLEPFYLRVMSLSFDPLAIELWIVLTFYPLATINSLRIGRLVDESFSEELLIPLNLPAFKEGLSGKAREALLDVCSRIHVAYSNGRHP